MELVLILKITDEKLASFNANVTMQSAGKAFLRKIIYHFRADPTE